MNISRYHVAVIFLQVPGATARTKFQLFIKKEVICKTFVLYITLLQLTIPQYKILCPQHISGTFLLCRRNRPVSLFLSDRYFQGLPQLLNGFLGKRRGLHNKCIVLSHLDQIDCHFSNATFLKHIR